MNIPEPHKVSSVYIIVLWNLIVNSPQKYTGEGVILNLLKIDRWLNKTQGGVVLFKQMGHPNLIA